MNNITSLATVLFVLSMISERFTEWKKNALSNLNLPFFLSRKIKLVGDTKTKYPDGSKAEADRQFRILKLNLFSGFIIAFACHANLFDLIKQSDHPNLGWDGVELVTWKQFAPHWLSICGSNLSFIAGCLFTGAFISLGSKFWHDLLDIFLVIKDVKRSATEELVKNGLASRTPVEQENIVRAAIDANIDRWRNTIKNFQGVTMASKLQGEGGVDTGQLCIQFNVSAKELLPTGVSGSVPPMVYYGGMCIPTDVKETGEIMAAAVAMDAKFTGAGILPRPGGSSICREGETDATGTLGPRINMDGKWYAFSCFHVLFPEECRAGTREIKKGEGDRLCRGPRDVISPSTKDSSDIMNVGEVAFGKVNRYVDIGFMETAEDKVGRSINGITNLNPQIHDFSLATERNILKVKFCGRTSGIVSEGVVTGIAAKDITYFRGETGEFVNHMDNLLELRIDAAGGDSGSLVVTDSGQLLGVITAVGNGYAYAVSMRAIFNNYIFSF